MRYSSEQVASDAPGHPDRCAVHGGPSQLSCGKLHNTKMMPERPCTQGGSISKVKDNISDNEGIDRGRSSVTDRKPVDEEYQATDWEASKPYFAEQTTRRQASTQMDTRSILMHMEQQRCSELPCFSAAVRQRAYITFKQCPTSPDPVATGKMHCKMSWQAHNRRKGGGGKWQRPYLNMDASRVSRSNATDSIHHAAQGTHLRGPRRTLCHHARESW